MTSTLSGSSAPCTCDKLNCRDCSMQRIVKDYETKLAAQRSAIQSQREYVAAQIHKLEELVETAAVTANRISTWNEKLDRSRKDDS